MGPRWNARQFGEKDIVSSALPPRDVRLRDGMKVEPLPDGWRGVLVIARRRWRASLAVTAVLALAISASAYGYSTLIANEWVNAQGKFGPRHTLTGADVDFIQNDDSYTQACVNALNSSDGSWAGSSYCTRTYVYHAYCGCRLRYGWNGSTGAYTRVVGVEMY